MTLYEKLITYGWKCQNAKYLETNNKAEYFVERDNNILFLLFKWTDDPIDWKYNLSFPIVPYSEMGEKWRCHRGFLQAWKDIEPELSPVIMDKNITKIIIVGYSQGGAISAFAHEYVWYHREDLRASGLEGYSFGSPTMYWGTTPKESLAKRWETYYTVVNKGDVVIRLPPKWLGYKHVGNIINIDSGEKLSVNGHAWTEYVKGIKKLAEES